MSAAEVVYAFVPVGGEPSAVDSALLDDAERERADRFVHARDRHRFVLSHAALRLFLARCLDIDPVAVRYETGVHGKPRLGPGLAPLEFNLSHAGDWCLIAASRDRAVGVDVEHVRDVPDALSIAETHFSPAERAAIRSAAPDEQQAAFFRCWTRKEAVIKAIGEGLSRALDSFDVQDGDLEGWSLRDLSAPPGYAAAGVASGSSVPWRALPTEGLQTAKRGSGSDYHP